MAFFRQYVAPLIVVLIFALSLLVVSARIFLPTDLAAPAPIEAGPAVSSHGLISPPLALAAR